MDTLAEPQLGWEMTNLRGTDACWDCWCEDVHCVLLADGAAAPSLLKGGRLARLYNDEGDASLPDKSSGPLNNRHITKVFTTMASDEQYGCRYACATSRVVHIFKKFTEAC